MDKEVIDKILAANLKANELKVLLAMMAGHVDIYDIQQATGLKRHRVEETAQNVQRISKLIQGYNTKPIKLLSLAAQNVRKTPPRLILDYLYDKCERPRTHLVKEQAAAKRVYFQAYEYFDRDQRQALLFVRDCIDLKLDGVKRSNYPAVYFQRVFGAYLASIPKELPITVYQSKQVDGKWRIWDDVKRIWRKTNDDRTTTDTGKHGSSR